MRKTVRYEIRESTLWFHIVEVVELMTKDGEIHMTGGSLYLPEDGSSWPYSPDELVSLLNDGLKFRGEYKDE